MSSCHPTTSAGSSAKATAPATIPPAARQRRRSSRYGRNTIDRYLMFSATASAAPASSGCSSSQYSESVNSSSISAAVSLRHVRVAAGQQRAGGVVEGREIAEVPVREADVDVDQEVPEQPRQSGDAAEADEAVGVRSDGRFGAEHGAG